MKLFLGVSPLLLAAKLGSVSAATCGGGNRGDGICPDDLCCSEFGWCGTSDAHCSGSNPPPSPTLPTGNPPSGATCGGGNPGDGICPGGECCSEFGWCGTSDAHCSGSNLPPSPTPPTGNPPSGAFCGCSTCSQTVWDTLAGDYTCGARITWLQDTVGYEEDQACSTVTSEFPDICRCAPSCDGNPPSTTKPTLKPTRFPTRRPTRFPTRRPTQYPTIKPTSRPSKSPNKPPTPIPTNIVQTPTPTIPTTSGPTYSPTSNSTTLSLSPSPVTAASIPPTDSLAPSHPYQPSMPPTVSAVPSQAPSQIPLIFDGIENAVSFLAGRIDFMWDFPTYDGEIADPETVKYHIFSSVGSYNFALALKNVTIEGLIFEFEQSNLNDNETQYHLVEGEAFDFSLNTTFIGELHTLFVIAEADGMFSKNVETTEVWASSSDPIVKEGLNVVGVFVPTELLDISLSPASNALEFDGPVRPEHKNLVAGDFVVGFTSEEEYFFLLVINIVSSSDERVVLTTEPARLEDIYDSLDYESSIGISRPNKVGLGSSSRQRRRHLIVTGHSRRLFFNPIKWVKDAVTDAVNFIGDNLVGPIADTFKELWELVTDGQVEKKIELVDFDVSIDCSFGIGEDNECSIDTGEDEGQSNLFDFDDFDLPTGEDKDGAGFNTTTGKGEVTASLVKVEGNVNVYSDIFVRIKVSLKSPQLLVEAGWRASYSANLDVTLGAEAEAKYEKTIWEGPTKAHTISIAGLPVVLDVQPRVETKFDVKVSSSNGGVAKMSMGIKEEKAKISATAEIPPNIYTTYDPPGLEPYIEFGTMDDLEFSASFNLVPTLKVDLYAGALRGEFAVSLGTKLDSAARLMDINGDSVVVLEKFDVDFVVSMDASLGTEFDSSLKEEVNLWEKTVPIISLPEASFPQKALHYCEGSPDGARTAFIENIMVKEKDNKGFENAFTTETKWFLGDDISNEWTLQQEGPFEAKLSKTGVSLSSSLVSGKIFVAIHPKFPPLPLPVVYSIELDTIVEDKSVECLSNGPCSASFFDDMAADFKEVFNSQIFLSQGASPNDPPTPSTVYKFEDFMKALKSLNGKDKFQMWLGYGCGSRAKKQALTGIAAFLGQAMRETIIYDACDENNWDFWNADVYKEPTSPPGIQSAFYPMSSSCGQLGQLYEDYECDDPDDACPKDSTMDISGSTNSNWIGAPPPLFCGPKSKYDGLGYWNPMKFCEGPDNSCLDQPFSYEGQQAGDHVSVNEDSQYPEWYYANPLPAADGSMQKPRFQNLPRTDVQGCCWWGRGVIQTTGRCNFGKLNKNIGAGASKDALYPDINFCKNPQALCDGPSELKWIAGIFFWTSEVEPYTDKVFGIPLAGTGYKKWVNDFIDLGCADDPELPGCDTIFAYASGIVNRGCPDPGETGCPGCIPGSTCDPAHNVPERVDASKQALRAFLKLEVGGGNGGGGTGGGNPTPTPPTPTPGGGTCGGGNRGDGVCSIGGECCSEFGWCGVTADHCGGGTDGGNPTPTSPTLTPGGGTCGGGNRGDGVCSIGGECCSEFGWCGVTADHCQ